MEAVKLGTGALGLAECQRSAQSLTGTLQEGGRSGWRCDRVAFFFFFFFLKFLNVDDCIIIDVSVVFFVGCLVLFGFGFGSSLVETCLRRITKEGVHGMVCFLFGQKFD